MSDPSDSEFKRLIGDVKPIKNDRAKLHHERPKAKRNIPVISKQPDNIFEEVLPGPDQPASTSYFDSGLQRKLQARIRSGSIRPERRIDLHGMRLGEARQALEAFLSSATARNNRMVLVIHGQGYGSRQQAVLKPMVHQRLAERTDILAWCPSQPADGGGGATYIYLKRN